MRQYHPVIFHHRRNIGFVESLTCLCREQPVAWALEDADIRWETNVLAGRQSLHFVVHLAVVIDHSLTELLYPIVRGILLTELPKPHFVRAPLGRVFKESGVFVRHRGSLRKG